MKGVDNPYVQADLTLRGVLMWAGMDWGDPHSLLHAAEGAAQKIRDLEREIKALQEQVSKIETSSEGLQDTPDP